MATTEDTCASRIRDQLKSRESQFEEIVKEEGQALEDGDYDKAGLIYEFPLAVSRYSVLRIDLSTGGPADWLEVHVDTSEKEAFITRVQYHFADWFDHAEIPLEEDSPLYHLVDELVYLNYNI